MKKIYFLLLVSGVFAVPAVAQHSFSIQYSMGFGGTINNFVTSTSLRGATFEYKIFPDPQVSIGIDAGWNHFYERHAYDTYTVGNTTYGGVQFRYADAVPIYLTTTYYFIPGNQVNPFIGVGLGTIYLSRYLDMGIFRITEDEWHFGLKPEAGALVSLSPDMDLILSLRYNKAFATQDTADQSFMNFNIGFVWK
jgi:hypothetical protein